jgi:hypothetical protein
MLNFEEIKKRVILEYPLIEESWTVYHVEKHPFEKCKYDWGMSCLYHFNQKLSPEFTPVWVEINNRLQDLIHKDPTLAKIIEFVPFHTGRDFILQSKPPYDGGYSTAMYQEFLDYGSCMPNEDILLDLAALHGGIIRILSLYSHNENPKDRILSKIIHTTFIKPNNDLFWGGDNNWFLYKPGIGFEDIKLWQELM